MTMNNYLMMTMMAMMMMLMIMMMMMMMTMVVLVRDIRVGAARRGHYLPKNDAERPPALHTDDG